MIGKHKDPEVIHVSSLGAFVFCPRAGIIKYRKQPVDGEDQEESRIPNLNYIPDFDLALLREKYNESLPKFWKNWGLVIACAFILAFISRFLWFTLAVYMFPALLYAIFIAVYQSSFLISIAIELYNYKHASAFTLDQTMDEPVPVDWWGLMKAGFVAIKPMASLVDEELKLSGRPWRVLRRNVNECIPVIGYRGSNTTFSDQHLLKLAAYCYLLQSQQNALVYWGIWLDLETKKGKAIPINRLLKDWSQIKDFQIEASEIESVVGEQVGKKVREFQKVLQDRRQRLSIAIPHGSHCSNCPYGKPRMQVVNQSETTYPDETINAFTNLGRDRRPVHSTCGDEFQWLPPHRYWAELSEN